MHLPRQARSSHEPEEALLRQVEGLLSLGETPPLPRQPLPWPVGTLDWQVHALLLCARQWPRGGLSTSSPGAAVPKLEQELVNLGQEPSTLRQEQSKPGKHFSETDPRAHLQVQRLHWQVEELNLPAKRFPRPVQELSDPGKAFSAVSITPLLRRRKSL